jgi:uncharacterized caspase-like protein
MSLGGTPGHADKRVALVMGNSAYQNAPALTNPKNDAEDVGRALRALGFETIVAEDLDRSGMNDALDRFSRVVNSADIALVYYSGHGMQFAGRNYLLPVDAKLSSAEDVNKFRLMPLDDVLDVLQAARGARVVILDACRNNPVEEDLKRRLASIPGANRDAQLGRGLGRISAGNGLIVTYSTQANDVAADGTGRNSPFTSAFLNNLDAPDLDLRQMLFRVQDEVDRETNGRQRPELSISLVGEFKLVPSDNPRPAAPALPRSDEASRAWEAVKDTASSAVLEAFLARYGDSLYAGFAPARLVEIRKGQVAAIQPTQPPALPTPAQQALPARISRPRVAAENCANASSSAGGDLYCASSMLTPQYGNSYGVRNLFSSDDSTAWVEGVAGQGIGQWVVVEFDGFRSVKSVTIYNGYQKNADIFGKNSRVRKIRLLFSQGETKDVSLEDRRGPQTIALDRPIKAYWVQFVIEDVYPGSRYTDTAISKLSIASERIQ